MTPETLPTRTKERGAIRPRRLGLAIDARTPRHWFDGDPVVSRMLDTLSLTFPEGEKFFVDSVRRFRDQARDDAHAADIAGFVAQEMQHSLEHAKWNDHLGTQGVEAVTREAESFAKKLLAGARYRFSYREQLAITAALEHVTAVLATSLLDDRTVEAIDPSLRSLWAWHALEEIEHKSVAFDLHTAIGGSHTQRRVLLAIGTIYLVVFTAYYTKRLLEADGLASDPRLVARGLWKLFGVRGLVSRAIPAYLDFYRADFHPERHATDALLEAWRPVVERMRSSDAAR